MEFYNVKRNLKYIDAFVFDFFIETFVSYIVEAFVFFEFSDFSFMKR